LHYLLDDPVVLRLRPAELRPDDPPALRDEEPRIDDPLRALDELRPDDERPDELPPPELLPPPDDLPPLLAIAFCFPLGIAAKPRLAMTAP
jgi:hypothetical protein